MKSGRIAARNVPEYIAEFPREVQAILKKLRIAIKSAAPDANEAIKYGMPTMVLNGNMLSYAAYHAHIGIYPAPAGNAAFQKALAPFRTGKNTVRFPLDQPIPYGLITTLVAYRVKEHLARVAGLNQTMSGILGIVAPPLGALLIGLLPITVKVLRLDKLASTRTQVMMNLASPAAAQSSNNRRVGSDQLR